MDLTRAEQLAKELIAQHVPDWHFGWDHGRRRFGRCHYRTRTITLSYILTSMNSEEEVRNVILHEIAHAKAPGHHHDYVWRQVARSIGCTGDRCYDSTVVATPQAPLKAVCKSCGKEYHRWKRTTRPQSCGVCNPRFDPRFILIYERVA